MKKWISLLLCMSFEALALEAVVTVLEAPMFKSKSYDAPVVQYLRKGDIIKVHPALANDRKINQYAPSSEKLAALKEKLKKTPEYSADPIFRGEEENTFYIEDEFIPMLDRNGKTVYVLSEHIYVYFNDSREQEQKIVNKDPTDYRLEEPLPKDYPLKRPAGYRGQFLLGFTQPNYQSYPYRDKITTEGYSNPIDLNFTYLRQGPGNYQDRLFIGGTFNLRMSENSYTFQDRRISEEENFKMGIGPTIGYDAYKGEKNRINLSGTIMLNFIDRLTIDQSFEDQQDSRIFTGYSISPRIHLQYHRKEIFEELDFIAGTGLEMGSATTFRAKNAAKEPAWWRFNKNDKFTSSTTFSLGGYIGIQSAY